MPWFMIWIIVYALVFIALGGAAIKFHLMSEAAKEANAR
jgi:hypothetical protein